MKQTPLQFSEISWIKGSGDLHVVLIVLHILATLNAIDPFALVSVTAWTLNTWRAVSELLFSVFITSSFSSTQQVTSDSFGEFIYLVYWLLWIPTACKIVHLIPPLGCTQASQAGLIKNWNINFSSSLIWLWFCHFPTAHDRTLGILFISLSFIFHIQSIDKSSHF